MAEATRRKTLLLVYPGCVVFEAALAVNLLAYYGEVDVAGPDSQVIHSSGLLLQPTHTYADVPRPQDYHCVVVPGGDPGTVLANSPLMALLQAAHQAQVVIGGICAGVLVLAQAGILVGRRITHTYVPRYAPTPVVQYTAAWWRGTQYVDQPVVQDGHLITALPQAHIDFALLLMQALSLYTGDKAAQMGTYFRGGYPFDNAAATSST